MFRRKPKSRLQRAKNEIIEFGKQAADTRKDVAKQLNRTVKHLRSDVAGLLEEGDERVSRLAKELEHVAGDLEKRTEKRIGQVSHVATNNVWMTILLAFGVGVAVGVLFKIMNHQNMRDME
jgi:uncharacterized membrane-anchored protein YhcB (DUF1043 family)